MTLQQLKYVTTVAQTGTISDAAKKLFISQPSLTKAVRELEKERRHCWRKHTRKKLGGNRNLVFPPSIIRLQSMHLWN